jgi:hypothetical protein
MLPKIKHPTFSFTIPSIKKAMLFRPFLTREEKILLIAKSSEDKAEIFRAIKQIVNNCCLDDNFDIDKLTLFDLEYLFLQLRAVSVNNIVKVSYRDNEDKQVYDFEIDITKVEVEFPKNIDKKIMVDESVGILMKYPPASILDDNEFLKAGNETFFELVMKCVDKVFDSDEVYTADSYTKKELEEFLDDCGIKTFEKIQEFMNNIPKLKHAIKYKNKMGNDREIVLDSLTDFFTLD